MNYDKLYTLLKEAKCTSGDFIDGIKQRELLKGTRASDVLAAMKLNEIVKQDEKKEKHNVILTILAIIGIIATAASIAYALYCYFTPDYLNDFDDDFDDDMEDDFFEDEEDDEPLDNTTEE